MQCGCPFSALLVACATLRNVKERAQLCWISCCKFQGSADHSQEEWQYQKTHCLSPLAVVCVSCEQTSRDLDIDAFPKEQFMVWQDVRINANKRTCTQGRECQACFGTRRRYFTASLNALVDTRKCTPAIEKQFRRHVMFCRNQA